MANFTHGYMVVIKTAERLKSKFNLSYVGTELILYAIYIHQANASNQEYDQN